MCGIIGVVRINSSRRESDESLKRALAQLRHRGPDASRFEKVSDEVILGHTRLSVVDCTEENHQPQSKHNRYWITYNGEIFNFKELRTLLQKEGHHFKTDGDTEVVLNAYIQWGPQAVKRFNGMWAFSIYDKQTGELFCSRDRFGEKPFNYSLKDGTFVFASEIRAILALNEENAEPNYNAIANFCRYSLGAQHHESWFKDIHRLAPAHNLFVSKSGLRIERYWDYPENESSSTNDSEIIENYGELFIDAVRVRLQADVPIGLTLSSGLDSTSIAYAMRHLGRQNVQCYTASFPGSEKRRKGQPHEKGTRDEASVAEHTAARIGFPIQSVRVDYTDFIETLKRIVWHLESGNSSPAVYPMFKIMEQAREAVTVLIEGQGADELLGGYRSTFFIDSARDHIKNTRIQSLLAEINGQIRERRIVGSLAMELRHQSNHHIWLSNIFQRYSGTFDIYDGALRTHTRIPDSPRLGDKKRYDAVTTKLFQQHTGGLVNLLHYGDAVSMAMGIESRQPFLDYRIVEMVSKLPGHWKYNAGVGKILHRRAMSKLLPEEIIKHKAKIGYETPIAQVLRNNKRQKQLIRDILFSSGKTEIKLQRRPLKQLLEKHEEGRVDASMQIFRMIMVRLWEESFFN